MFAELQNAWWPGYLHADKMKSNGLHVLWLTKWRALAERVTHFSSVVLVQPLLLLSFPFLSTPPTLTAAATTTTASTFQIAIFVTVSIDVEKAIIWASRSGNRVLVEVGHRQALFLESSPSRGCRGQWVPMRESRRSMLAIFSTFTLGLVVFASKDNTSH